MKNVFLFGVILLVSVKGNSQNLVVNPEFEPSAEILPYNITLYSDSIVSIETSKCIKLQNSNSTMKIDTSLYKIRNWNLFHNKDRVRDTIDWHVCSSNIENVFQFDPFFIWGGDVFYLGGMLKEPLVANRKYIVSIKIRKFHRVFSIKNMGIIFSSKKDTLYDLWNQQITPAKSDIEIRMDSTNEGEINFSVEYHARGNEQYFFIGLMNESINKLSAYKISPFDKLYTQYRKSKKTLKDRNKFYDNVSKIYNKDFFIDEKLLYEEKNIQVSSYLLYDVAILKSE